MAAGMWAGAWHDEGVDDRALIDAVLGGDRDRFAILVERETPAVYRACLRILAQPHDAEDATQEAFITAFRSMRSFRGDGSLRGWLLRIATRVALRRVSQRRPADALDDSLAERLPGDSATEPATAMMLSERRTAVRDAVVALPDQYREVVALRFFADLSLAEIATITGRPLNTVKTHLRRGLERLEPALAPSGVGR
jgi:RNA polymerase sigma-70 factor, ECF subfamily